MQKQRFVVPYVSYMASGLEVRQRVSVILSAGLADQEIKSEVGHPTIWIITTKRTDGYMQETSWACDLRMPFGST